MSRSIPLIGLAEAGTGGFFDDGGFPVGSGWDEVAFPAPNDENAYALEISGNSMEPAYRKGDIIIVSPAAPVRRGDRVVVKTKKGRSDRQAAHTPHLPSRSNCNRSMPIIPTAHWRRRMCCGWRGSSGRASNSEHDPEKWEPVFGQDHAQTN
jgi:hypothetical protein